VSKESIHSFFDALDAQNDLYARYAKASLRDQTIFQTMVILDYKIPSLSEYNEAIRRAEQRFTFSSVRRMLSESIFRKHFCENEEAAAHIIVERLSQANIALPNGASVALTTPEEVIQILTEALQAHIIYAERLEQYAKGPRKEKPKYPVLEAGQDNIPHPHLAPINYHFFSIKEKRLYHAMSLPLSMQPKSWGGIEFGLVFEENEFRILHCSPLSPLPPKQ
jgi:hypothetical protein